MQLLNVSQGGNLFLHLPEDLPKALPHLDATDPNHRHPLIVEAGSLTRIIHKVFATSGRALDNGSLERRWSGIDLMEG